MIRWGLPILYLSIMPKISYSLFEQTEIFYITVTKEGHFLNKCIKIKKGTLESVLANFFILILGAGVKATKLQITRMIEDMGSHEKYEIERQRSSIRKVHQIIRNLRLIGLPIVSDDEGSWLARSTEEVLKFCDWLSMKAGNDIKSMLTLRRELLDSIDAKQVSIFDKIEEDILPVD